MATHTHTQEQDVPYTASPPPPTIPPITTQNLILIIITFVILFPAFLLMRLVGITSASDSISDFIVSNINGPNPVESQYRLQFSLESSAGRRLRAAIAAVFFFLATLIFPSLRSFATLGSPLYNWSLLTVVVFCFRYLIDYVVREVTADLGNRFWRYERWSYYVNGTLFGPLGSAIHATLILLTWRFFRFSTVIYPVTRYGVWVVGAWMMRCVIILFNSAVLARWRANALFDRYEERILRVGFQFHIMYALIPSAGKDISFLAPWRKKEGDVEIMQIGHDGKAIEICCKIEDHIRYISRHKTTKQEVALVAMHIQGFSSLLPPELGDTLADSVRLEQRISPNDDDMQIDKKWIKEKMNLNDEDARVLYGELSALVTSPDQVSFQTFSTWIRAAYKDNLDLGQTLRDGDNVILNSDRLLMALLINKAFLLWLFLTGKTTTQVLSVIPFVYFAKSFIQELSSPHFKMLIG